VIGSLSFLAEDARLAHVREALQSRCGARFRAEPRTEAVAYDTFDWRLFAGGQELWLEQQPSCELVWVDRARGPCARYAVDSAPRFAADLPPSGVREALAPLLGDRALFPVARIERRAERLDLKDSQQKVVARVRLLRREARQESGPESDQAAGRVAPASLPTLVAVEPVRGYDEGEALARWIEADLGLSSHALDDLAEGARALGQEPGRDPSKLRCEMEPMLATSQALKRILGALLDTVVALAPGTRQNLDAEFLHDFRVAVRRARSLLRPFRDALPPPARERLKEGLRALADATGAARDLDVFALAIDGYLCELGGLRKELAPVLEHLEKERARAHQRLRRELESPRHAELIGAWRELVDAPPPETAQAAEPIVKTASARIWKRYKRMRKKGAALLDAPTERELHPLRIQGKKLRYVLELFPGVFPAQEIEEAIELLKSLQSNLGEINDLKVHEELIESTSLELLSPKGPALIAAGRLSGHLAALRREKLEKTERLLERFTGEKARELYERLFHHDPDPEPVP
jgi:CHAD domain-containing protein